MWTKVSLVVGAAIAGYACNSLGYMQEGRGILRHEALEIVDKRGKVAMRFFVSEAEGATFQMFGSNERPSVEISAKDGEEGIAVRSSMSKGAVKLRIHKNESPRFEIFDNEGIPKMLFLLTPDGSAVSIMAGRGDNKASIVQIVDTESARIQLYDKEKNQRLRMEARKESELGAGGYFLFDGEHSLKGSFGFSVRGEPLVYLSDSEKSGAVNIGANKDGVGIGLTDGNRKLRASVSVKDEGPFVRILDANEQRVWSAP